MSVQRTIIWCVMALFAMTLQAQDYELERAKRMYYNGDYKRAAVTLRPLAEQGNAEAQFLAGCLFASGRGVVKSPQQCVKYMTLSANQGYEPAVIYLVEKAKQTSEAKAALTAKQYCDKFPNLCDTEIGATLAVAYAKGIGVGRNLRKATDMLVANRSDRFQEKAMGDVVATYIDAMSEKWHIDKEEYLLLDSIYADNPELGEYFCRVVFDEFKNRGDIMEQFKRDGSRMTPTWAAVLAQCYYNGWGGLGQHHQQAKNHAQSAAGAGSPMGKYLLDKYRRKHMVGYVFRDDVVFEMRDEDTWDKVYRRVAVLSKCQDIQKELKEMGDAYRLPTKKEAEVMMKYRMYFDDDPKRKWDIWVTDLPGAKVYYLQTYDYKGNFISEAKGCLVPNSTCQEWAWVIGIAQHK